MGFFFSFSSFLLGLSITYTQFTPDHRINDSLLISQQLFTFSLFYVISIIENLFVVCLLTLGHTQWGLGSNLGSVLGQNVVLPVMLKVILCTTEDQTGLLFARLVLQLFSLFLWPPVIFF